MTRRQLLPESALQRMGTLLAAIERAEGTDDEWRSEVHIHVLRNYTTEPLDPFLKFHLLRDDIRPTITHGGYGTIGQELLDPEGQIARSAPDVLVLSLLVELIDSESRKDDWSADSAIEELSTYVDTILNNSTALLITNTFLPPVDAILGSQSYRNEAEIERLNEHVLEIASAAADRVAVCDWRAYGRQLGPELVLDERFWKSAQAPFRAPFLDLHARRIASFVRASAGLAKKCLILDCDDTLWGGVIGESGIDGIELDDSREPGASYHRFQQEVIALSKKGVMVAICSKNNEEDVWMVLDNHAHALLNRSHLVAWRINWEDKAKNIESIVRELNIGMDSVVFVDDNPRELALIAACLPDVSVVGIPEGMPATPELLQRDAFFETLSRSTEDADRTRMYQEQSARNDDRQRFSDLSDYIRSLRTIVIIDGVDKEGVARVSQLTQKTNQFNLTTRRYSEADIKSLLCDPLAAIFRMAVSDRFGDMGVTGVFIATLDGTVATIDTLLLSCRILGRNIESAFVDQCMQSLEKRWTITEWRAEYSATRKNRQTENFWERMGFRVTKESESGKHYASAVNSRTVDYHGMMTVKME